MLPLTIKDLFKLKPGDKYVVYWAKDDKADDVRLNYETLEVETNVGGCIMSRSYAWYIKQAIDKNSNQINTARGTAYFYRSTNE